jgi:hypothetical protein
MMYLCTHLAVDHQKPNIANTSPGAYQLFPSQAHPQFVLLVPLPSAVQQPMVCAETSVGAELPAALMAVIVTT